MSHRELAEALRALERERTTRLLKEKQEREELLADMEERSRRELEDVQRQKEALAQKVKKEQGEIDRLRGAVIEEAEQADQEQTIFDLQRRILEFQGNDNASLRERLIKEGFSEELVTDSLRRRTLEQSIERPGGLQARFTQRDDINPLERLMGGVARPEDLRNRDVLYAVRDMHEEAAMKGYLSAEKQQQLDTVMYLTEKFQANEFYKGEDQHGYFSRIHDAAEAVRKNLGLDGGTSHLTYGGKKDNSY